MLEVNLKPGKYYKTRGGYKMKALRWGAGRCFGRPVSTLICECEDGFEHEYSMSGKMDDFKDCPSDIITEWTEEKAETKQEGE